MLKRFISLIITGVMIISVFSVGATNDMDVKNFQEAVTYSSEATISIATYTNNGVEVSITTIEYADGNKDSILSEDGLITKFSTQEKEGYIYVHGETKQEMVINPVTRGYSYVTTEYYQSKHVKWTTNALAAVIKMSIPAPYGTIMSIALSISADVHGYEGNLYFKNNVRGKQEWNGSRLVFKYLLDSYYSKTSYNSGMKYKGNQYFESLDPVWGL